MGLNKLLRIILIIFSTLTVGFSSVSGQSYFRVVDDIPHFPVLDPATITNPETGMLIFSSTDSKPMIYTGSNWESLCTSNVSAITAQEYFVVKNSIPFLPTFGNVPVGTPASGTIYYSTAEKSIMVFNGTVWLRMVDMLTGYISESNGFRAGSGVKTVKLPVLSSDPTTNLVTGAFYINSFTKIIRYYDGSMWQDVSCQAVVKTLPITSITGYTAASGAQVITNGGSPVTLTGICWSPNANPDTLLTSKTRIIATGSGIGTFNSSLTGLLPKTTYHVRAYAVNILGIVYGDDVTFTTPIAPPQIITLEATNLTSISAESGGNITADGGASVTKRGIIWSVLGDPLNDPSHIVTDDGSGVGQYPSTLDGLLGSTSYYVRAYAVNSSGTAYGNLVQFTTPVPVPPVLNPIVTVNNVTGSSAICTSTIQNNGGALVTERGICYSTDHVTYTYVTSSTVTPTDIGTFITNLTGLAQGTTYYIKGYAKNSAGIGYSSETSFITASLVNITTMKPNNITGTTALSGGTIADVGNSVITLRGICWSTDKNPTTDLTTKTAQSFSGNGVGDFFSSMTGLLPGTKYYVRAYAVNGAGTAYGNLDSLTTLNYPAVRTIDAAAFNNDTGIGGGEVLSDGGSNVTERGVCWDTAENPTINSYHTSDGTGLGLFYSTLTGLTANVTYHMRAYARNSVGVAYGADMTFIIIPEAPEIITLDITNITSISANSGGDITSNGGASITKRGIVWSTKGDPLGDPSHVITDDGSGVGLFPSTLDGLLGNTTYYVRAYAVNSYGKSYGNLLQFTTPPPVPPVLNSAAIHITDVTSVSSTGSLTILNNGGALVTARGICWSTDRIHYEYIPSTTLTGTDVGTFIANVAGLMPGVTYYAKGYATNSAGTSYTSEVSFVTASLATITTTPPSSIAGTTAVSGGFISDPGNATITARGVCWSSAEVPTTANSHTTNGADVGNFGSTLTNLTPGVKYYVRAYAINVAGTAYGNLDSLTTLNYPVIATLSASSFVNNTATGGGNIISDGGAPVTTRGICWSTTANPTVYSSAIASGSGLGLFSGTMTGLSPNVIYHVRAYAYNSVGYAYGEDKTFTIIPGAPSVTTLPIHDVTSITAIGGGNIIDNGASAITSRGIRVSTKGDPVDDLSAIITSDGIGNGSFTSTLNGLFGDTIYYVRAYAANSYGMSYGDIIQFVTPAPVPPALNLPLVRVTDITATTGIGTSTILNNGGAPVTSRGICVTTDRIHYDYIASTTVNITDLGEFTTNITGLLPGVTYYAKGYATNTAGTGYTNEISFVTPTYVSLTTIVPNNIIYSSAQSGGVISSNGNAVITARGICWSTDNNPTTALTTKTEETSGVNVLGSFSSKLTGLTPNTKFYVRAYAVNVAGTAYGNLDSLVTEPLKFATLTTTKPNNASYTTAQSGGTVTNAGNTDITGRGICWSLGKNPVIALSTKTSESLGTDGTGSFTSSITGLLPSVKYYVRAYAVNLAGVAYGNLDSLVTVSPSSPSVVTVSVASVTGSSAKLAGEVVGEGGSAVTERGLCWSTTANPTYTDSYISSGSGLGAYSVTALNLVGGTVYHVRAYAINSAGITYGDDLTFTTDVVATISTTAPTNVSNSSAVSGGSISNDGGDPVTTRGVCWSVAPNPTLASGYTTDGSGIGNFVSSISGLYGSTRYYVRAYALNTAGVAYGNEVSFVTASSLVPTVATIDAINIGATTAEIRGNVSANGGQDVTERGICWGTSSSPTIDINHVISGSGNGAFSGVISGLTKQTKYYARAYAINSIGIAYGADVIFTTVTLPTVTTSLVSSVTGATAKGGGSITSDGGAPVTTSGLCWNTAGNPTIADPRTVGTIGIGDFIHTMTGLMGNTIYYVRAYAINSAGVAYGDPVMFMSGAPELSTLTTVSANSGSDGRSLISGGNVSSNGGSPIVTGGLCWSTVSGFKPDTVTYNRSVLSTTGSFGATISGLKKGTTYYVRAYVINGIGTSYGNEVSVSTFEVPMVLTVAPNPGTITNVSAISGGSVLTDGGAPVTSSGICWSTVKTPTINNDNLTNGAGGATFTSNITNLLGGTTYYARAFAVNGVGIAYGNEISFTTLPPTLATIVTDKVTLESATSATCGGTIVSNGGALVTTRGLFWCTSPNFSTDTITHNKTAETGYFVGSFTHSMSGLLPNTTYYVKAYVINSAGIAYGDEASFTTPALPSLTTAYAIATGSTKASSGGDIANDGGSPITSRGVVWSTIASFNPDTVVVNKTYNGGGIGSFLSNITGLKGSTTYYIQAYATNVAGTGYGNLLSFITDPAVLATLTTRDAWSVAGSTAYSGGYISDNGGEPVTTRGVVWSTVSGFRPDTVVINKVSQTGTGIGYFATALSNLQPGITYYIRAFAINSVGVAYGNQLTFKTLAVPSVTTSSIATSANGVSASGGGKIVADGGATVYNQGVCWSIGHNPTISLSTKTNYDSRTGDSFNSSLTGLNPATTYYVRAYAINSQGVGYGDEMTFTTPAITPTITTTYTTIISKSSVVTGGNITYNGGAAVTARGVIWSTVASFVPDTVTVNKTSDGTGSGNFTSTIAGLNMSLTYYIRAYATNSAGTAYGNQVNVTIFPTAPRLITTDITQVGGYSALSGGQITSDGGAPVTLKGLCWATHTNPTVDDIRTYDGSGTDTYVSTITGLTPNTMYYVRAYAVNKIGTAYGIEKTILTNALPTLTATKPVTNIIATTATSGGEITDDGRTPILARGLCWSTYSNPTIALDTKTIDNTTTGIGEFFANMTGLKPETVYYLRAYATNAVGTSYGSQVMFKTHPVELPTVTTTPHTYVDSTLVVSGGTILNDGGMPVNERGVCWSLTPNPTTSLSSKLFASTGGTGSFTSSITGLLPGKKYYIRAFGTNSLGTAYGLQDSVVTYPVRPTVSVPIMSNIKMTTADAVASVITDGGSPIMDKGVYWNTTGIKPASINPGDSIVSNGAGGTAISGTVINLTPNTTYYIWSYATNSVGIRFSTSPVKFTTPTLATVITLKAKSVWQFTAVSGGNITSDGGAPITERGVCYSNAGIPTIANLHVAHSVASTGIYSLALDSLKEGTTYYVRAYAINTMGINYGNVDTLKTLTTPTVITNNTDSIWSTGMIAGGKVMADGGMSITSRGICWSSTVIPTIALATKTTNGYGLGTFISTITGLVHDSVYFYRAYATNSLGTSYGKIDTIRTLPIPPILSEIKFSSITLTSVVTTAQVLDDGGADVTKRGICWNTTGNPTMNDHVIIDGAVGVGVFKDSISGLVEGPSYYVRAFAVNSAGVGYGPDGSSFKSCPSTFTAVHVAGFNGAPVSKTVTYHSVSTSITGALRCWLTQNLGADTLARTMTEATEKTAGWYWQFNRSQGYKHNGTTLTPSNAWTPWVTSISESSNWTAANDPCNLLLSLGWRMPTQTEWSAAAGAPQNWASATDAWKSVLQLHNAGYLEYSAGGLTSRGSYSYYWTGTQYASTSYGYTLASGYSMTYLSKAYALPVRCIRDTIVRTIPMISNVTLPDSSRTTTSALGIAVVVSDGGASVTARGLCYNTTGNPTISDNIIDGGSGTGSFQGTMDGLVEGTTYYVRAYATNKYGTAYSPLVTTIISCPVKFDVIHTAGTNGAPVTRTVTYHSVAADLSGKTACWLTQNLGAYKAPASTTDANDSTAGWYFQFNRSKGYIPNGTSSWLPKNAWESWPDVSESSDWVAANDPCNLLLGTGWRVPTYDEWLAADAPPQNWNTPADAYNSVLKLHLTGWLQGGSLVYKGSYGRYWSSKQINSSSAYFLYLYPGASLITYDAKSYACPVRCIRQSLVPTVPIVSNVVVPDSTLTTTTADCIATVALDGGAAVTDRGICWNTTGNPTLSDNVLSGGNGTGSFTISLSDLVEGPTYYVRAYATNSKGTAYSSTVTSFKICPSSFSVIHTGGLNGAPVSKTVTYHSIYTTISGKAACWLTQNLGADRQATSATDATESSAGWYWQFNRSQGYKHDGSTLTPSNAWTAWITSITESSDWAPANDPCNLLLGLGWRLPTNTEWVNAIAPPQYWTSITDAYKSVIKLHNAGTLEYSAGGLTNRGSYAYYWSGTQYSSTSYGDYIAAGSSTSYLNKAYANPARCIRDAVTISAPSVSNVTFPTSGMTANSAAGTATVSSNGGATITARGLCWNTTGSTPTLAHYVITDSDVSLGAFTLQLQSLSEDSTYYVRAYATNSKGTSYSPTVTSFKICPQSFPVIHTAGINGAASTRTVTYHSISSSITGSPACWLTQNLGAYKQPTIVTDANDSTMGWYFQFNRKQGYVPNGTSSYLPKNAWESWPDVSESSDWLAANDPCNLMLGTGWRVPTYDEWLAADAPPQNWGTPADAFNSVLKLHLTGWLQGGSIVYKGSYARFWSNKQINSSSAYFLYLYPGASLITYDAKSYACPVRCIRKDVVVSVPMVSNVSIPDSTITTTTAACYATVTTDGGAKVVERGLCWNTTGTAPVIGDNKISVGEGVGAFPATLGGLSEGPTYYVRAYAINSKGVAYSSVVTSFKICPRSFDVIHTAGLNGAPVTKTVTYHSINTTMSGKAACWLTQNLGADRQPTSATDATESSAGWYWQFNRSQGYKHDGSTLTPSNAWTAWITSITESSDWTAANDPCNLLLGLGWRLPTNAEWVNAIAPPQYWTSITDAYKSVIKLHNAGTLEYSAGGLTNRGSYAYYWSGTQYSSTSYGDYIAAGSSTSYLNKAYANPVRCIRDQVTISAPSVSNVSVPTSGMTATSADGTATIASDGGDAIMARGLCWNTTGTAPTLSDHVITDSNLDLGSFTLTITGLLEGSTYYVRAYATNSKGTTYSPTVTSFKICPASFSIIHTAGVNGAPVTKTVTYHSISSSISGSPACWLTQNLGADQQPAASNDGSDAALGWYFQFNRSKGYIPNGTSSWLPKNAWESWPDVSESSDWVSANDPCNLLLGNGWRVPTYDEWFAADAPPQNWGTPADGYNSVLKLHLTGWLQGGAIVYKGTYARFWSNKQINSGSAYFLYLYPGASLMTYDAKSYACPVRCIRQAVTLSVPTVSTVSVPDSTLSAAKTTWTATVTTSGGAAVTARGLCWNTTGTPTVADSLIANGSGLGIFSGNMTNLVEGPTYYVRAYATNSQGTAYSPIVTSFKICPRSFDMIHTAGLNGAPVSKTVTYHSINTTISGKAACWLTQNLGADRQATAVNDATESSAGWYWQFNRSQGYKHDGSTLTPSNAWTAWITSITESSDWTPANDPCNLLLGLGWRLPTNAEWVAAIAPPQYWTSVTDAYNSIIKLHNAGTLEYSAAGLTNRGSYAYYWSGTQYSSTSYGDYIAAGSSTSYLNKAYANPVRCIRDAVTITAPYISNVNFPTSGMTANSAAGTATVASDGGATVTVRGLCWNTSGIAPTLSDNVVNVGNGIGNFTGVLNSLIEGPTYYVCAFATNSKGTTYSPAVTSFKICPQEFSVIHNAGTNGAPVSKTVTYHSISSSISGSPACWLTQNLGADQQPAASNDGSDAALGWYFQFNRKQGYIPNGTSSWLPKNAWESWPDVSESSDWITANDPCNLMLGTGWRVPTYAEWLAADAPPQNWGTPADGYNSVLKLHLTGWLQGGAIVYKGTYARFWSSNQLNSSSAYYMYLYPGASLVSSDAKSYACPVRCIRQAVSVAVPMVSAVSIPNATLTATTADCSASIPTDGGAAVTERGICWNTTGTPTTSDNKIAVGSGVGSFTTTMTGLGEGPTYYVRAYATNSQGTAYSPTVTSFKICPSSFDVIHTAGLNGAPVTKTVTYHSVNTLISGKAACWLTQNLGADHQATALTDATEASAGWYWQFNRSQGYKHDGSTLTPSNAWTAWITSITESSDWITANDPCNLLLGLGWRLPTNTEWVAAIAPPQYWTSATDAYNSIIKLHNAGTLEYSAAGLTNRGSYAYYWSGTQYSSTSYGDYIAAGSSTSYLNKAYANPVRCIRDAVTFSAPSVSNVTAPTSAMTATTADGIATVTSNGGAAITAKGLCWSTSSITPPSLSDNVITDSNVNLGVFTLTLSSLTQDKTYYVRAYATNSKGTTYSPAVTSFKMCPQTFSVIHTAGTNGAPVSKTVTYNSISSSISGSPSCWLTQNLGADQQPAASNDGSDAALGWYFQFNRKQGYIPNGTSSWLPKNAWESWPDVSESSDWVSANDPCSLMLGTGWRVPTYAEWLAADAPPQNWGTPADGYNSVLKLHLTGWLQGGAIVYKGTYARFWSSNQLNSSSAYYMYLYPGASLVSSDAKSYACPVRCIRQAVSATIPTVSVASIPNAALTATTATCSSSVTIDGGASVTERGICWNTTGTPVITDNKIAVGNGVGSFSTTMTALSEGPTYYVRAYATNSQGTAYSSTVTSFKICPSSFDVIHTAGLNGAPVTKTVTYNSLNATISGKAACWLTQNLGADRQATAVNDATESSAGWYWQFNRSQGYKHDGSTMTPNYGWVPWISSITESSDWTSANDPCNLLLGLGWRLPTNTEWVNAIAPPQYWTSVNDAYSSIIKLHNAGCLEYSAGGLTNRGSYAYYWSGTQYSSTSYGDYIAAGSSTSYLNKAYANPVRCIRDAVTASTPTVSAITFPTSGMTANSADGTATVTLDGGANISERGICWNTTGNPTTSDNKIANGSSIGTFTTTISGLSQGPSYYVRAYATNSKGTTYSSAVTSFKICPQSFAVTHTAGVNGAPVSKTVTYHSISSNISGSAACWLTQNLGADQQATALTDATEASSGWYWQFNRSQGYKHDGTSRTPATAWVASISESSDWSLSNDPCNLLLGSGWRIPTNTEWTNADAPPQYWNTANDAWNSVIKLHNAGCLEYSAGGLTNRGSYAYYWTATQYSSTSYGDYIAAGSTMSYLTKAYATPLRCLRP